MLWQILSKCGKNVVVKLNINAVCWQFFTYEKNYGEIDPLAVNFINILCAHFLHESQLSSFSLITFGFAIFWHQNISKKFARKMLMKLTLAGLLFLNLNITKRNWELAMMKISWFSVSKFCIEMESVRLWRHTTRQCKKDISGNYSRKFFCQHFKMKLGETSYFWTKVTSDLYKAHK